MGQGHTLQRGNSRRSLIASLIVLGCSYREIADILKVNVHVIHASVRDICLRAGMKYQDRMKLAVWWLKSEGIVE